MATVKVTRNFMVLPIDSRQLDKYLKRGWVLVQNPPAVVPEPVILHVQIVEPVENKPELIEEKPKRKPRKKKTEK